MAYSTSNPPAAFENRTGGGFTMWLYNSTDTAATVRANNYISNARELGMNVGDLVLHVDIGTSTNPGGTVCHFYVVAAINASGSANLSDGTAISVANTD